MTRWLLFSIYLVIIDDMKTIKKLVKDSVEYVFPGAVTDDTTEETDGVDDEA